MASLKKLLASVRDRSEKKLFFESKGCSIEEVYFIMYIRGTTSEKITDHTGLKRYFQNATISMLIIISLHSLNILVKVITSWEQDILIFMVKIFP